MILLKDGLNENISNADYHGDRRYLSSSVLKLIKDDEIAFHIKYIQGIKDEPKDFFDFGTYMHAHILEPHTVSTDFAVFGGARKFGEAYNKFVLDNPGKTIVTAAECEKAAKIMLNFRKHPLAPTFISAGKAEQTFCSHIKGVNVKVRTDYIKNNCIIDVKTTSSAITKSSIEKVCKKFGYPLSAALYLDTANLCLLEEGLSPPIKDFYFLFIGKKDDSVSIFKASEDMIERGRKQYLAAIDKYLRLQSSGFFDMIDLNNHIVELA